jgi:hypothetical protein
MPPPPPPPVPGQEYEPNNSLAQADTVVVGDSIVGSVHLPGDVDYFTVSLQAGTSVAINSTDLSPVRDWSWIMELMDSTGVTLAQNDEYQDWLPGTRIWYSVTRTGLYYVRIYNKPVSAGWSPPTSGSYPYTLRISSFHPVAEREPNDHATLANVVALGDTVSGILVWGDSDYYALDLNAGTNLNLAVSSLEVSCTIVPEIRLWTSDGNELARRQSSPYNGSWNPRLEYVIPATGRYYVSFGSDLGGTLPGNPCYFLKIGTFTLPPPGPAEPIRVIASGGSYSAIASSRVGDVYVASGICETPERNSYGAVARLEEDGSLRVIADQLSATGDLAVDGSGNILVPGISSRHAVVWRISPAGDRSIFVELASAACALAVGPDGDVWVSEYATGHTLRVDSLGNVKGSAELGYYVDRMKVSPGGVLYYLRTGSMYKLENGDTTRLIDGGAPQAWTFDRNGDVYAEQDRNGGLYGYNLHNKIVLLDPRFQPVVDLVAYVNSPVGITFVPDRSGAPTKRLLVLYHPDVTSLSTAIGELNPAGIRAPGP